MVAVSRHAPETLPDQVAHQVVDVTRPAAFRNLPGHLDVLVYCLSPSGGGEEAYEAVFGLAIRQLLARWPVGRIGRILFVSSTSVYAQDDDSWVDENSPAVPRRPQSRILRRAEQQLLDSGHPVTIVRFSGIYGGHRTAFLDAVLTGQVPVTPPSPWTNRIHESDAAGILAFLANRALAGQDLAPLYIGSDCEPVQRHVLANWILEAAGEHMTPDPEASWPARGGSKRLSNARIRAAGYAFRYPTWREGYSEMLARLNRAP
ncbi:nucleoside-diphosphate sugar epimerase [Hahella sp. SMD15-11]|uniref:Nucleoside-diphosphate sugar epimerase n=1 Tax=Thermohahella caldifontis TaxID=3142973 RepID=A0AB39UUA9_9GAMM